MPDLLRHEDRLADQVALLDRARSRLEIGPPGPLMEVEVDKTLLFTRQAALLTLEDRIAYQAAVAAVAERVETQTPDAVFSARLSRDRRYFLKRGAQQWVTWRKSVLRTVNDGNEWLVETDLTAYFDTIPHRLLFAEIEALGIDGGVFRSLKEMLSTWSPSTGVGLPQGPNASRLLANLYMLPVDHAMLNTGWKYSRYLDDIRIATPSRREAVEAFWQLQNECRTRGLIVSSSKSNLRHGNDARASLGQEADLAAIEYLMTRMAPEAGRAELKATLKKALKPNNPIDNRRAKFSLWRLASLREGSMVKRVLSRLEDLGPLATVTAAYLRPFISRKPVVHGIAGFLGDRDRTCSRYFTTWLLAAVLEHAGNMPPSLAAEARKRLKDRNEPAFLRCLAAVVVVREGRAGDRSWLKAQIQREHDPQVLRGYAVALHSVADLDKATQRRLVARSSDMAQTLDYLRGRNRLPSLVQANAWLPYIAG